jgi:hypothetical protein
MNVFKKVLLMMKKSVDVLKINMSNERSSERYYDLCGEEFAGSLWGSNPRHRAIALESTVNSKVMFQLKTSFKI